MFTKVIGKFKKSREDERNMVIAGIVTTITDNVVQFTHEEIEDIIQRSTDRVIQVQKDRRAAVRAELNSLNSTIKQIQNK